MMAALNSNKHIARQVFPGNIPGLFIGSLDAADTQPLALTDCVVHQPGMAAYFSAIFIFDIPRLCRKVLFKKVFKAALTNKTDAGAVLFIVSDEVVLLGKFTHFRLCQFANGKQGFCQSSLINSVKEIALILIGVQPFKQKGLAILVAAANIMAGGNRFSAKHFGIFEKNFEFDFPITENVRVGGSASAVFGQK